MTRGDAHRVAIRVAIHVPSSVPKSDAELRVARVDPAITTRRDGEADSSKAERNPYGWRNYQSAGLGKVGEAKALPASHCMLLQYVTSFTGPLVTLNWL